MASEIIATDPVKNPTINFKVTTTVLLSMDKMATRAGFFNNCFNSLTSSKKRIAYSRGKNPERLKNIEKIFQMQVIIKR